MPHPTSQVSTPVHKKTSKGQMSIKHTERDTQENLINMPMLENRTKTPRDTRTPMKASFRVLACVWVKGRPELCRAKQPSPDVLAPIMSPLQSLLQAVLMSCQLPNFSQDITLLWQVKAAACLQPERNISNPQQCLALVSSQCGPLCLSDTLKYPHSSSFH